MYKYVYICIFYYLFLLHIYTREDAFSEKRQTLPKKNIPESLRASRSLSAANPTHSRAQTHTGSFHSAFEFDSFPPFDASLSSVQYTVILGGLSTFLFLFHLFTYY